MHYLYFPLRGPRSSLPFTEINKQFTLLNVSLCCSHRLTCSIIALHKTISLPYDKTVEIRQDFSYNLIQSGFELIARRTNPVCRQVLLHTSVGKKHGINNKKNIDQMRVNNIKQI